jgi:hypothetical protein
MAKDQPLSGTLKYADSERIAPASPPLAAC